MRSSTTNAIVAIRLGELVCHAVAVHVPSRLKMRKAPSVISSRERIIRVREVVHRVGVHRGTIYKWIKEGRFPRQVPLGANSAGWYESEIDAWISDPSAWAAAT